MTEEERATAKQMTLAWWERRNLGDEDRIYDDRDARSFYCAGIVDGRESMRAAMEDLVAKVNRRTQQRNAERARSAKLIEALRFYSSTPEQIIDGQIEWHPHVPDAYSGLQYAPDWNGSLQEDPGDIAAKAIADYEAAK